MNENNNLILDPTTQAMSSKCAKRLSFQEPDPFLYHESDHESEDEQLAQPLSDKSGIKDSRYSESTSLLCNNQSSNYSDIHADSFSDDSSINEQQFQSAVNTEHHDTGSKSEKRKVNRTVEKEAPVRKRRRQPEKWMDNVAKDAKDKGESYVNRSQKTIPAKNLGPGCSEDKCRLKCQSRISTIQRCELFTNFSNMKEKIRKWNFIIKHTDVKNVKNHTTHWESRRNFTQEYFFTINDQKVTVCKTMFLDTLSINDSWIRTAFLKVNKEGMISPEKRGKHSKRSELMKLKSQKLKSVVKEHINMFARVPSHYNRKNSQREYLRDGLSIGKMHQMYLEWWSSKEKTNEENSIPIATERQYRDILNTEFNIGFHKSKKDKCDTCVTWENATDVEKQRLSKNFEDHIKNKTLARNWKECDKLDAKSDENICMACFDLQKILNVPQGENSAFFYKRSLSVYNFTVFDCARYNGFCYVWNETIAKKGSTEVASGLFLFIEHMSKMGVKEFRFYSDNCGSQNRNRYVFGMYLLAAVKFEIKITHRFLEKGHTQNEGDSVHATIERNSRRQDIYSQDEWCSIIRTARTGKHPYTVTEITQDQIFDPKKIIVGQNWTTDDQGRKVAWSKIRELTVDFRKPFQVNFRYGYEDIEHVMFVNKNSPVNLKTFQLQKAYNSKLPVPSLKVKDLISLCNSGAFPTKYHAFYKALTPQEQDENEMEDPDNFED